MGNLLLNSLVVRQQASGVKNQKNSEHFAHYYDQSNKKSIKQATGIQKISEQNAHYYVQARTRSTRSGGCSGCGEAAQSPPLRAPLSA